MSVSVSRRRPDLRPVNRMRRRYLATGATRRRALRQLLSLGAALLVALAVHRSLGEAARTRARWGPTTVAVVAARDLPAGTALQHGDLGLLRVPRGMVPQGSLTVSGGTRRVPTELHGERLRHELQRGEILNRHDLAARNRSPVAALLSRGRAAVTVATTRQRAPVTVGDDVDVYGVGTSWTSELPPGSGSIEVLQRAARVLVTNDDAVTLAVDENAVTGILEAARNGEIALVLRG